MRAHRLSLANSIDLRYRESNFNPDTVNSLSLTDYYREWTVFRVDILLLRIVHVRSIHITMRVNLIFSGLYSFP